MYFKGFKLSVSLNFAGLVLIGMLLTNLVATVFWHRHAIRISLESVQKMLSILANDPSVTCAALESIGRYDSFGDEQDGLNAQPGWYVYHSGRVEKKNGYLPSSLRMLLEQSALTGKPQFKNEGRFVSVLGVGPSHINIAYPVQKCETIVSVGTSVPLPSIRNEILSSQPAILVYLLVNVIILTTLWFFRMRRIILEPLDNLLRTAEKHGVMQDDLFFTLPRKNEFGQLAAALDNMITTIENDKTKLEEALSSLKDANEQILANQKSLVEAERFAAVGRLSAGLAHEIGNPLGIVQGYVELLSRTDIQDQDRLDFYHRAEKELSRVTMLIQQLLDLARKKHGEKPSEPAEVSEVVENIVTILKQQKNEVEIEFHIHSAKTVEPVNCGAPELHQVLLNCLMNSVDAIQESESRAGRIDISYCRKESDSEGFVEIIIEDNGCGMRPEDVEVVFDPFFTTKEIGQGTGLGLSVSRSIIENCGGSISLDNRKNQGAIVTIVLPVVSTGSST